MIRRGPIETCDEWSVLMAKMSDTGEEHRYTEPIGGLDYFGIAL